MTDLKEIIRLAEAATPGPWRHSIGMDGKPLPLVAWDGDPPGPHEGYHVHDLLWWEDEYPEFWNRHKDQMVANAAFIAAANPATVKAMAERLMRLEEALLRYANPELYKPHPHGPAFDRPDKSYIAREALENKP